MKASEGPFTPLQALSLGTLDVWPKPDAGASNRICFVGHAGVDRIAGLTWRPVKDVADVAAALAHGTEQRATSATAMNATSSRSHAVLSVKLAFAEGGQSSLHLVDLAGRSWLRHESHACLLIASMRRKLPALVQFKMY